MVRKFFFLILLVLFSISCGLGNSKQDQADRFSRAFALTVRTFVNFFQDNLGDCEKFFEIYDELSTDPVECDNGAEGFFQLSKGDVSCEEGPPLNATANFTMDQVNCRDDGTNVTSDGFFNLVLTFSAAGNIGVISANGIIMNDLPVTVDYFWTKVNLSNNNLSCSDAGDMNVDGENCDVTSNCQKCRF